MDTSPILELSFHLDLEDGVALLHHWNVHSSAARRFRRKQIALLGVPLFFSILILNLLVLRHSKNLFREDWSVSICSFGILLFMFGLSEFFPRIWLVGQKKKLRSK